MLQLLTKTISKSSAEGRSGLKRGITSSGSESPSHQSTSLHAHETRFKNSGLLPNMSWEAAHGSLLVISEMLKNMCRLMISRFHQVCETVLLYRDARIKTYQSHSVLTTPLARIPLSRSLCASLLGRHGAPLIRTD